jgi:hypothetical protein
MLDIPSSEVVWRVLATHSICQFPFSLPLPCVTMCHRFSTGLYQLPDTITPHPSSAERLIPLLGLRLVKPSILTDIYQYEHGNAWCEGTGWRHTTTLHRARHIAWDTYTTWPWTEHLSLTPGLYNLYDKRPRTLLWVGSRGSIPDGFIEFFYWHNPSGRTMALRSTQPLTEMSTKNVSWG